MTTVAAGCCFGTVWWMNSATTRLLVLRHGQSEWNALGRWQGQADPPLSDAGMQQAAEAALRLGMFDGVWASDLQRASLTAAIIAEIIGIGPVQLDPRLREIHAGPWQGLTHTEVDSGWPGYLQEGRRPDGFESLDEAAQRAVEGIQAIAERHRGGEVLVITHGGIIRSLSGLGKHPLTRIPNLGGAWFTVDGDRLTRGEFVEVLEPEISGSPNSATML